MLWCYGVIMTSTGDDALDALRRSFAARPDISARSVLVTIFGDSILPHRNQVWLKDLIALCQPLGFSDRLIRTSIYRLQQEGWFTTERVGRQARYQLNSSVVADFESAETTIYQPPTLDWDNTFTLVVLPSSPPTGSPISATVESPKSQSHHPDFSSANGTTQALRDLDFLALAPEVLISPRCPPDTAFAAVKHHGLAESVSISTSKVDQIAPFQHRLTIDPPANLRTARDRYESFLRRYNQVPDLLASGTGPSADDFDHFVARTMAIHDYRRARLIDPDYPTALLDHSWPANIAYSLAATIHAATATASGRWVRSVLSPDMDAPEPPITKGRFPPLD